MLDDLFTYRLDADRYLTVTNASNHERDLAWFHAHADDFPASRSATAIDDWAMLAVQGPLAREIVQAISDSPLPARMSAAHAAPRAARRCSCAAPATPARTASSCCADPEDAAALWDELVRRGAVPAGLGARDTLRLEVCFHLYGNDLSVERGPIEAGLGWCCKEDTGFIGAEAVRARARARPRRAARRVRDRRPRHRAPGQPVAGGGEVTSGTLSPCLETGIGMAYVPAERAAAGTRLEIDVRGKMRPAVVKDKPLYRKAREWPRPAIPTTCSTTPSTTGRASTRTTHARDARHHLVRPGLARRGRVLRPARRSARRSTKDAPYAEVESVKAVSDVVAPLSGEIVEVNEALAENPAMINEDPYGEGWLVKVRLSDPAERDALLDAATYRPRWAG